MLSRWRGILVFVAGLLLAWLGSGDALTAGQLVTLRNDIAADGTLNALPHTSDTAVQVADAYNLPAVVDCWVWRTAIPVQEIYETTTPAPDNTTWSWTVYIARTVGERDAWREMTASGLINASLANTRQGLQDIFSQGPGAAQRAHLLVLARRKASRLEKLFATGACSTAAPSTMQVEGTVHGTDVEQSWAQ